MDDGPDFVGRRNINADFWLLLVALAGSNLNGKGYVLRHIAAN
jgi:hypothetical protein